MMNKLFGLNWKTNVGGTLALIATLVALVRCFTCKEGCLDLVSCLTIALGGGGVTGALYAAKDANVTGGSRTR